MSRTISCRLRNNFHFYFIYTNFKSRNNHCGKLVDSIWRSRERNRKKGNHLDHNLSCTFYYILVFLELL